jgi:hypothetical protein
MFDNWDDKLEEYAPGWLAPLTAAIGTSVFRPESGEELLEFECQSSMAELLGCASTWHRRLRETRAALDRQRIFAGRPKT